MPAGTKQIFFVVDPREAEKLELRDETRGMDCPKCNRRYDGELYKSCPYCSAPRTDPPSGAVKRSLVLIASGKTRAVYKSVKEVPEPLRRQLLKSTAGLNSATILIADRRGREQITRAIRSLPPAMQGRLLRLILGDEAKPPARQFRLHPLVLRTAAAILTGAASWLIWLAFWHR
jgi:hypothetical protein